MGRGIIVFGAPGSGTSTVGRALAKKLDFTHFETDDFFRHENRQAPFYSQST